MAEEVEVTIDREGNVTFDVRGVKGKSCENLTRKLEEGFGKVTRRRHKASYFQKEQNRLRQGN